MSNFYRKKYDDGWTIDDSKTLYDDLVQLSHKYKKSKDEMFEKIKTVLHNYNPNKHQYYNKNRGKYWTEQEENILISCITQGLGELSISKKLGRSRLAIQKRIEKLTDENKIYEDGFCRISK